VRARVDSVLADLRIQRAFRFISEHKSEIAADQIRLTEIPAPPFQEAERARAFSKELGILELHPTTDSVGNVFAAYEAAARNPVIIDAHLDTVFPASTALDLRRKGQILFLPGISDNGSGIVAVLWALRAAKEAGLRFGQLGYDLVEKRGLKRFQARTYNNFAVQVLPWTRPVKAIREMVCRAFEAANKIGDLTFAAFSCGNLVSNLLAAGDPLDLRVRLVERHVRNTSSASRAREGRGRPPKMSQSARSRAASAASPPRANSQTPRPIRPGSSSPGSWTTLRTSRPRSSWPCASCPWCGRPCRT